MNSVVIRDYTQNDYDELMKLWQETELGGKLRSDDENTINQSIQLGGKLLILENTTTCEVIGSSWMTFDGRRIHLHHVGVLPKYQNKGYGKMLSKESIKFAKEKGFQIKLEVNRTNKKAIEIYKKLGFSYLGDYDVYIIRNFDSINF